MKRMISRLPASLLIVILPAAAAAQSPVTPEALFDFCRSPSIEAARQKGEAIGWPQAAERDLAEWREAAERTGASRISVVGWRQPGGEGSLSFWTSFGQNTYRACAFTTREGQGLREVLEQRFGAPDTASDVAVSRTAFWKRGSMQAAISSVGEGPRALVYVNIANLP